MKRHIACVIAAVASIPGVETSHADPTSFQRGLVAADHELASCAGAEMLARGGNAVDAAIATSFTLSVVRPMSCGIGGGGFMLIHDPDAPEGAQTVALNYRETAPQAVGPDFFVERDDPESSRTTGAAVGVPGTVAGLWEAHRRFGSLPWAELLEPAIRAAEEGFTVNEDYLRSAKEIIEWYDAEPSRKMTHDFVWRRFLREGAVAIGDVITNPEQGKALRLIAQGGPDAFHQGAIAEAVVKATKERSGVMTRVDLAAYAPRWETPLTGSFMGRTVVTMPPPSSGGVATLQALGAYEQFVALHVPAPRGLAHNHADSIHVLTEIFKHVFADRAAFLADAAHVEVPVEELLSEEAIRSIADRIDLDRVLDGRSYGRRGATVAVPDDAGTSHFSIIDANGMAVSCTETINLTFGSRIAVEEFGFCLNNEMDDFTTVPGGVNAFGLRQSDLNLPAPGKRPLSSMTPTIVLGADGRVELITGARGGPRIITATIQSLLNAIVFEMSAAESVAAPRIHHQGWPPFLAMEPALHIDGDQAVEANPAEVMRLFQSVTDLRSLHAALREKGHLIGAIPTVGVVEMIARTTAGYAPGIDPRGGGDAFGVDGDGKVAPAASR